MNEAQYRAHRARTAKAIIRLLQSFPADGRLTMETVEEHIALEAGFIERRTVNRPCKTCGTARRHSTYFVITNAGRLLLAYAETRI